MGSDRSVGRAAETWSDAGASVDIDGAARGRRLVLRPGHGPGVGVGHLVRCFALGQAWRDLAGSAVIASAAPLPHTWADRCIAERIEIERANGWIGGDAFVLDGYGFGADEQRSAPPGPLCVIDDLGQVPLVRADVIVDQNLSASPRADRPEGAQLLLGPRYAMLRREIARSAAAPHADRAEPLRVLITAGGAPDPAWLDTLREALPSTGQDRIQVEAADGSSDMAVLLRQVSVAVTASGSTIWELLAHGIASVVVAFADNQRPVARALDAAGVAIDGGDYNTLDHAALKIAVATLLGDPERRALLAARGRQLVDGRGASRVAHALAAAVSAASTPR